VMLPLGEAKEWRGLDLAKTFQPEFDRFVGRNEEKSHPKPLTLGLQNAGASLFQRNYLGEGLIRSLPPYDEIRSRLQIRSLFTPTVSSRAILGQRLSISRGV